MQPFDLLGELPKPGTTLLEASAGTGKTYALAGLVTRYVAEGHARLDEMLLITFGRAASDELRSRVRAQLQQAERALADPAGADRDLPLIAHLLDRDRAEDGACLLRLRDALAGFDAATIATTHQFCHLVLRSLGVAGDTDSGVTLVEDLGDVVTEVIDDLYLARFADAEDRPVLAHADALTLAREVVSNPHTRLVPDLAETDPTSAEGARVAFAHDVLAELERRKRRQGILGFDDLLTRLAAALEPEDSPARTRMRNRWRIVMVDEFQDTDPVQWEVLSRAFGGHGTVILIGDPKQAIYAFRGGDVSTYLAAAESCDVQQTLGTNYRADKPLVDALGVLIGAAALGDDRIVVRDVEAWQQTGRLQTRDPALATPVRLRVVQRTPFGVDQRRTIRMDQARPHIAKDLAADIGRMLADGEATYEGRPLEAKDIAVLVGAHLDARACRDALAEAGIPAVYAGDTDVFGSEAADDWLCLLEALDAPHRSNLVRAAAATRFFGRSAQELYDGGDRLTDEVGDTLRRWADHLRRSGPVAVYEAARLAGMAERVLGRRFGERHLTDLAHLAQLLHEAAHTHRLALPALLDWFRSQREERESGSERARRLDSDAAAVQIMTVWVAKGLEFPVVYLPFLFNRNVRDRNELLFHDADGRRSLAIGGPGSPSYRAVQPAARDEDAGDAARLTYVALTRARSQVVAWWAPTWDECNGGLSRLLRGRGPGEAAVPAQLDRAGTDDEMVQLLARWRHQGGLALEPAVLTPAPAPPRPAAPVGLAARRFDRTVDLTWRRTSYSGLLRSAAETAGLPATEPEHDVKDDEVDEQPAIEPAPATDDGVEHLTSPLDGFAAGAGFGSLVHAVLEHADPAAGDLRTQLLDLIGEHAGFWGYDGDADALADALLPSQQTPLGPLCSDLTLADLPFADRLCELDFEIPLAGGDTPHGAELRLRDLAPLLRRHLPAGDPLRSYADRLADPVLGAQPLRGYLSGSIDVVLRVPFDTPPRSSGAAQEPSVPGGRHRYVVVDYKTNRLGPAGQPVTTAAYTQDRLAEAMLHSDYPLQALFYGVVLHRYLRWRLADYTPQTHLGGVAYLYLRGMVGPETPVLDGHPTGVFSWPVPAELVVAVSDLLDRAGSDQEVPA